MKLEWKSPKITIDFDQEEVHLIDYLVETRGIKILEREIGDMFKSRTETVKEELKRDINSVILTDTSIKGLKDKLDEVKKKP